MALFYLEDYSYQEIAVILEVPVGTVKSRISRGIAQLREIFESKEAGKLEVPRQGRSRAMHGSGV